MEAMSESKPSDALPRRADDLVDQAALKAMKIADRPKWQGPHCDKCGQMLLTKAEVMTHACPKAE
jgi:hypothetical protein